MSPPLSAIVRPLSLGLPPRVNGSITRRGEARQLRPMSALGRRERGRERFGTVRVGRGGWLSAEHRRTWQPHVLEPSNHGLVSAYLPTDSLRRTPEPVRVVEPGEVDESPGGQSRVVRDGLGVSFSL